VNDAAALNMTTATAEGGGDMWVGASGAKVEVALVDMQRGRDTDGPGRRPGAPQRADTGV
jgi:hypothetical protein